MAKTEKDVLTDLQREIMEIVWAQGEVTVSEVREKLAVKRKLARNSIQTMMARLEDYGWLNHRENGRTFIYSAKKPKESSLGARVSQMIDRLFAGNAERMMTALIEYRGLTAEEAKRIRAMIQKADRREQ